MAIRIHHTQVKQAAKLGITLTKGDMDVTASKDGQSASAPSAGLAIAALLKKLGVTTADLTSKLKVVSTGEANKFKVEGLKQAKAKRKAKDEDEDEDYDGDEDADNEDSAGEGDEGEGDEGDEDDGESKSVVKAKYKTRYRPHKMTCGDDLAQRIRKEFMTVKDPDTGKLTVNWKRFVAFAKSNECWTETYMKLNPGMRRMNVVNRLRAKIKAGHKVVWSA